MATQDTSRSATRYPLAGQIPGQTQVDSVQPGLQHVMSPLPVDTTLQSHPVSPPSPDDDTTPSTTPPAAAAAAAESDGNGGNDAPGPVLEEYRGADRLLNKVAIITGGDSGIGRSAAVCFAREGADVVVVYTEKEERDARECKELIESAGRKCLLLPTDITSERACASIVSRTLERFGRLDILVNNAAKQYVCADIADIATDQMVETFATNVYAMFWLCKAALPHMRPGACIINWASVVAYKGSATLLDYAATKGAIVAFTRSLALNLAPRGIRVNAVAPGPIYTPLQPASRTEHAMDSWQDKVPPLGRVGQPAECGPSYVFLASNCSSYYTGQVLHPNGGFVVNA